MKMLIDVSSVLWMSLLAAKDEEFGQKVEHDGKTVHVNGWQFGLECATAHITSVARKLGLSPAQMIFVVEGRLSKARRKNIYSGYKEGRDNRPDAAYEQFARTRTELTTLFRNVGAQIVTQDGVEADDVIAYLAQHLEGEKVILSQDGDLAYLINDNVSMYRNNKLVTDNPYGPFPNRFITVFKALVGDTSDNIKGAPGFGEKAFLNLLVWGGDAALAAFEGIINRRELHTLEDDVAEFKPMRKIIDGAQSVYTSYDVAKLYPEWINTRRCPLIVEEGVNAPEKVRDERVLQLIGQSAEPADTWWTAMKHPATFVTKNHAVFDCELIGSERPVFLVCFKVLETGEVGSFWWHKDGDMAALHAALEREDLTWVSFNGNHFDAPLVSAAIGGKYPKVLKQIAEAIIVENGKSWEMPDRFGFDMIKFDHIDLIEVSPGVRVSLKTFAGRMGYPTMVDLPFDHNLDLDEAQMLVLESYCQNDLGVTDALFTALRTEINLRTEMSEEHGIDLRSKSDAQVAEAVLKKAAAIKGGGVERPTSVTYTAPKFIQTGSDVIQDIVERVERTQFAIHPATGQVEAPEFLDEPVALCSGTYQMGVGGLHSTHDKRLHVVATDEMLISDFDVASYYPNIMLMAGLTPRLANGAGQRFIDEYRKIYVRRMEAKRAGNKQVANALKISLNGTFGKLGSPYSAFYSPDLMLAVTMTGQLNLMQLIYELEYSPEIKVLSANTDGIMVQYPASQRGRVLDTVKANAIQTGFEYEETRYRAVAMKDVNNYIAITSGDDVAVITPDGQIAHVKGKADKAKRKGLYTSNNPKENPLYLMKNPTHEVCSNMACDYLREGVHPSDAIAKYTDIREFVAIRNVKGGGIQYDRIELADDWECVNDLGTKDNEWRRPVWPADKASVKRKSRPAPVEVGVGGEQFGRIARWFMQKDGKMPINYVGSGNRVPKTDGAKLCMTLPDELPADLDTGWYVAECLSMLDDMGVKMEAANA